MMVEETQTTMQVEEDSRWMERVENLVMALELYSSQQNKAMYDLTKILEAHGVDIPIDTIQQLAPEELQEQLTKYEEKARGGR